MKKRLIFVVIFLALFLLPSAALAQDYYFSLNTEVVHAYWQADGTLSLEYSLFFSNSPSGHAIEFVDLGLPNGNFSTGNIYAEVNGQPLSFISTSEYQGRGTGVAIGLEGYSIAPGAKGMVYVSVIAIENVLYPDTEGDNYASAMFSPSWFDAKYVSGNTDLTVVYHLPPGVQPEEPRWHAAPSGFPESPLAAHDPEGRITYTWNNPNANAYTQYEFGASFPAQYVPESAVTNPSFWQKLGLSSEDIMGCLCPAGIFLFIIFIIVLSIKQSKKRKLKYLPPKMKIEGNGIKRGLTAIEAAILLEKTPDKILTMILFATLQKSAAQVISRDPLKLKIADPIPKDLRKYEVQFLNAFKTNSKSKRKTELQDLMIDLIKSVGEKMKGFSHKESVKYYESIMQKAWSQVEAADTPEVKSEKYNDNMGWTMLDDDFENRTQEVFRQGPVFVPLWWHRYDPNFGRRSRTPSMRTSAPSPSGKQTLSLPNLPGGEFAASMVSGIQSFSGDVVGNITNFTDRITNKTNPIPKSSSSGWSSSSGGSSCACACACAGCACACAGGGR
ncbi:MAG: hypothetical protein DRI56_08370 [Chloroflexota bacterium]|nr:MAG: hypothetical protein DRI56_08370 [Chloroflexota bacterium]